MRGHHDDRQADAAKNQGQCTHINDAETNYAEKPMPVEDEDVEQRDYTGAARKTDPEEIRLVRKLDWCIMVSSVTTKPILAVPSY
jgi:hypothetical protein